MKAFMSDRVERECWQDAAPGPAWGFAINEAKRILAETEKGSGNSFAQTRALLDVVKCRDKVVAALEAFVNS